MALFRSLRVRVIVWVSVALTVLFAITVAGLDVTFRRSTDQALRDLLEVQVLGLVALAEADEAGSLTLRADGADPQFQVVDSGLYGVLLDAEGRVLWRSQSLLEAELPLGAQPAPGEQRFFTAEPPELPPLAGTALGIEWEFGDGRTARYAFAVAASLEPYRERQASFRRNLIGWFAGVTLTMLLVVAGLLQVMLQPLRRLERQVREVDSGERVALTGQYPAEVEGLAASLNALIDTERRRLVRYRNTLDDLAHSLKTPLAVMRSLLSELTQGSGRAVANAGRSTEPAPDSELEALGREVDRMEQRVSYQLRRARASGATGLGVEPVPVAPVLEDLCRGLDKVYRDKRVSCELDVADGAFFQGDPGDLTEVLGNLLDNAYKYCRSRVEVTVEQRAGRLMVTVADDGRGIAPDEVERLIERGGRADESVPGQGIGLAVVREIVALYGGTLRIDRSGWGGAAVHVELARATA